MDTAIEATLTGSDSPIEGTAYRTTYEGKEAFEFRSTDETLHLVIFKDTEGHWHRATGTEPYFSGWADELAEQVEALRQ